MEEDKPTWSYSGQQDLGVPQELAPTASSVSWTASEFIAHDKNSMWYAGLFGAAFFITAVIYLINRDILTSVVILSISVMIAVMGSRKPSSVQYSLSSDGLTVGSQQHRFSEFRSFSVVEEGPINSIWLKPLARFKPMVVLYFAPEDELKIVDTLSLFLPHEQRELDAVERASRRLRF
ncbi:hypothetical protein KC992_00810 [Candidatus Saccharibacteria bacterium]|nr:hypothetical protein [Candidatus Saccharibacteria bacterium]